jgi:hypothetical protein
MLKSANTGARLFSCLPIHAMIDRFGGVPMRKIEPGSARSCGVISPTGAPNLASARHTTAAFFRSGPMKISRSFEARG